MIISLSECVGRIRMNDFQYRLKEKMKSYNYVACAGQIVLLEDDYLKLEQENKKLRECVEFYAGPDCGMTGQSIIKDGERARQTLKELDCQT